MLYIPQLDIVVVKLLAAIDGRHPSVIVHVLTGHLIIVSVQGKRYAHVHFKKGERHKPRLFHRVCTTDIYL